MKRINVTTILQSMIIITALCSCQTLLADAHNKTQTKNKKSSQSIVAERTAAENEADKNPYVISLYAPTYILPALYTGSPYYAVYQGQTPDNQRLTHTEVKGQLSFKVNFWTHMFGSGFSLAGAYTQDSFWQVYTKSPYFRETNYMPELFLTYDVNKMIRLKAGIVHQSNGRGGEIQVQPDGTVTNGMERSWNRVYSDFIVSGSNWMVDFKAWMQILKSESSDEHNPDIRNYMGNTRLLAAYKFGDGEVVSFMARNMLNAGFRRPGLELTWSYPINKRFKIFLDGFSGYGQSLIEYNHYTNSVGIGIALNDWI